jgi:hypothetical protein
MAWYVLMISCSLGLWALDVVSHDYSSIQYIFLALIVMLINPIGKAISLMKWLAEDLSQKPELPSPPLKTRVLSEVEQREQKTAKLEAENKLKLLNASKNWERSHNKEVGVPNK